MKVVLDTDVVVAALQSPEGASRRLLLAAVDGLLEVACSVPLMLEWEAVLKRPAVLAAAAVSATEVDDVLDELARVIVPVELHYVWRPVAHDADDDVVLETAINGEADRLVTFSLRHLQEPAARFGIVAEWPAITVRRLL